MNIGVTGTATDGVLSPAQFSARNERQLLCVERVVNYLQGRNKEENHPAVGMPTGFGKGHVIARLIDRNEHKKILLIAGTKDILRRQTTENLSEFDWIALKDFVDTEFGEGYSISVLPDLSGDVVVTIWQGLAAYLRRNKEPEKFGLAIIDEVHNAGTQSRLELLRQLNPDNIVGLTATAYRSSGELRAPEEYGFTVVDTMTLPECIREYWLSSLVGKAINMGIVLPEDARRGGNLNFKIVNRELRKHPDLYKEIARKVIPYIDDGKKTVIAVNRVRQEACVIARELMSQGIKVGLAVNNVATRALSNEFITLDAIERYKLPASDPRSIQVLISCQVIGEGFDEPSTECIVWAAPTLSGLRYTQVMGRGARQCPGKRYCLVLDFVYMIESYGYSMNFAQFFQYDHLQEMEGGFFYLGPDLSGLSSLAKYKELDAPIPRDTLSTLLFPESGDWLNPHQIIPIIAKSWAWINKYIPATGITGEERRAENGRIFVHYPPEIVNALQELLEVPEAGDWLTVSGISAKTGKGDQSINKVIAELGIKGEERLGKTGRFQHYSPEDVEKIISQLDAYPSSNGWITINTLMGQIPKSQNWIEAQLERMEIPWELRRGEHGVCKHYHPDTLEVVRAQIPQIPAMGDWITIEAIYARIKRWKHCLSEKLAEMGYEPEERITPGGKIHQCYPPVVIEKLAEGVSTVKDADGWITANDIADADGIKRPPTSVKTILGRLGVASEKRRIPQGRVVDTYPPDSLEKVRQYLSNLVPIGNWNTIPMLVAEFPEIGEFRIKKALEEMNIGSEERQILSGQVCKAYPPKSIEALRSYFAIN